MNFGNKQNDTKRENTLHMHWIEFQEIKFISSLEKTKQIQFIC